VGSLQVQKRGSVSLPRKLQGRGGDTPTSPREDMALSEQRRVKPDGHVSPVHDHRA
jgi:hypothetical protein